MKRPTLILTLTLLVTPVVASAQSIEGVWQLAEYEGQDFAPTEPVGLMILADGHYSRAFVRSENPRQPVGDSPTPEQQMASWQAFIANSGRYTLDGSTLTLSIDVAKVAGVMGTTATAQVQFDGDAVVLSGLLEGDQSRQRWVRVN